MRDIRSYSAPVAVDFDITLSCNQRCVHCNVSGGRPLVDEMSTDEVCSVLDEMHSAGVYELALTGGEPLCRPDWRQIVHHAANKPGWLIIINTNATLWTDDDIKFLADTCPRATVAVSLDGYDPESYSILRIGGAIDPKSAFHAAANNIQAMTRAGITTCVNYTITNLTVSGLVPTYRFVLELGVTRYLGIKFFPYGRGKANLERLELPDALWSELLRDLTVQKDNGELPGFNLSVTCPWEFYLPLLDSYTVDDIARLWDYESPMVSPRYAEQRELGCTAGITSCAVSPDGSMFPCGTVSARIPELLCGNIATDGLVNVWKNSPMLATLRGLTLDEVGEPCVSCHLSGLCGGGCQARAFVATGRLGRPDPLCPLAQSTMEKG